jgi:predicted transcriptional regulator
MLEVAREGVVKTKILYNANLSYEQLKKYLELLSSHGFIQKKVDGNRETWTTTEKGLGVIEACQICRLIFKESEKIDKRANRS